MTLKKACSKRSQLHFIHTTQLQDEQNPSCPNGDGNSLLWYRVKFPVTASLMHWIKCCISDILMDAKLICLENHYMTQNYLDKRLDDFGNRSSEAARRIRRFIGLQGRKVLWVPGSASSLSLPMSPPRDFSGLLNSLPFFCAVSHFPLSPSSAFHSHVLNTVVLVSGSHSALPFSLSFTLLVQLFLKAEIRKRPFS